MSVTPDSQPPKRQSAGGSMALRTAPPAHSWKSMAIWWGSNIKADFRARLPLPFVRFEAKDKFQANSTLTNFNPRPNSDGGYRNKPEGPSGFKRLKAMAKQRLRESVPIFQAGIASESDGTDEVYYSELADKTKQPPRGVVTTEIRQWVVIEVQLDNQNQPPPKLHVWAFLQPRGFDKERPLHSKLKADPDESQVTDSLNAALSEEDLPRSGWAEYKIDCANMTAVKINWDKGTPKEVSVPNSDIFFIQHVPGGYRIKLDVVVKNELTAGDIQRRINRERDRAQKMLELKAQGKSASSQSSPAQQLMDDFEAGCWLKLWVRNAEFNWASNPSDDDTDLTARQMKQADPVSGRGSRLCPFPNHGYLRGRLAEGNGVKRTAPHGKDIVPIYAVLLSPTALGHLKDLHFLLAKANKKPVSELQIAGALLGTSIGAVGLAYILYSVMEKRQKSLKPPTTIPTDQRQQWMDSAVKKTAESFTKLLETFHVAESLAGLGVAGFTEMNPADAIAEASKSHPDLHKLVSMVYQMFFDMSLASNPAHYRDFHMKRLDARKDFYDKLVEWSKEEKKARAADKKAEAEKARAAKKSVLGQLKLGFDWLKQKSSKSEVDGGIDFKFSLADLAKKKSFPAPMGAPLPIPFLPLLWSLDFEAAAKIDLDLSLKFKGEKLLLTYGLSFPTGTKVSAALGLHTLWSFPDLVPDMKAHQQQKGKDNKFKRDLENYDEAARQAENAQNSPVTESRLQFLSSLQSLQSLVDFQLFVSGEMTLEGFIGGELTYDPSTHHTEFAWSDSSEHEDGICLGANFFTHLQLSILSWRNDLIATDSIVTATSDALTSPLLPDTIGKTKSNQVPMEVNVLGTKHKFTSKEYKWGKGDVEQVVVKNDASKKYLIWGKPNGAFVGYKNFDSKPSIRFSVFAGTYSNEGLGQKLLDKAQDLQWGGHAEAEAKPRQNAEPLLQIDPGEIKHSTQPDKSQRASIELRFSSIHAQAVAGASHRSEAGGLSAPMAIGALFEDSATRDAAKDFVEHLMSHDTTPIYPQAMYKKVPSEIKDPFYLMRPTIGHFRQRIAKSPRQESRQGILVLEFDPLGLWEDTHLWVRLNNGSHRISLVQSYQNREWNLFPLLAAKESDGRRAYRIQIDLKPLSISILQTGIFAEISLAPDACGILNKKWLPSLSDQAGVLKF